MNQNKLFPYGILLLMVATYVLFPDMAYAGQANSVASVLCKVLDYIWGPIGTMIAILGVICLGLIAMFGKMQLSNVLTVMAGIALIFGSKALLAKFKINVDCGNSGVSVTQIMDSQFYTIMACIVTWFIGPLGKALASLGLIAVGLFAAYGRISWHQAILVAVGIATMFGSVGIVEALGVPINTGGRLPFSNVCGATGIANPMELIFCNLLGWFAGSVGKGIASVALLIVGAGALFGKVSWPMTMVVALGIALIFGAPNVINALGAVSVTNCAKGKLV